ncbi:MAG: hypothetical protein ACJZ8O_06880 [Pirellulaceae bacterium]
MHPIRLKICEIAAELLASNKAVNKMHARRTAAMQVYGNSTPPWFLPTMDEIDHSLHEILEMITDYPVTDEHSLRSIVTGWFNSLEGHQFRADDHPEKDVEYHLLQTFDLCIEERPYDMELAFAGLVHDLGFPISPREPTAATIEHFAVEFSDRVSLLLRQMPIAHTVIDHTAGHRARKRFMAHEYHEDALFLAEADLSARQTGVPTSSLSEALSLLETIF